MENLENKTVIITGASKGIGRALALELSLKKMNLVLIARNEDALNKVQELVIKNGAKCLAFIGSVADESFVNNCISGALTELGNIDFLVNNAGIGAFGSTESYSINQWEQVFDTNTKGVFLFSKAVLPYFKSQQKGHIITIASDVAKRTFEGGSLYCASKYAFEGFCSALRKEVRKDSIKVSVVYSGLVDTHFHKEAQGSEKHLNYLTAQNMANSIKFIMQQPQNVVIDELMIHPLTQEY